MADYPCSVTDKEWEIFKPLILSTNSTLRGRPEKYSKREIINGILYIIRTGGAWRMMPHDLPHWKTCYHYFRLWAKKEIWKNIHDAIREMARLHRGKKKPRPLRLSIVKAFAQLANPEFVVMMRVRRLQEENDIFW